MQQLATELILDAEFEIIVEEESKFKMTDKYRSWYNGFTALTVSHVFQNIIYFLFKTTESNGEITTPDYEKNYPDRYLTSLTFFFYVFIPENLTKTQDLELTLEGNVDTKETEGEGEESLSIYSGRKLKEKIHLSGKQSINITIPVFQAFASGEIMYLRYKRHLTDDDMRKWEHKRNTGLKLRWSFKDNY